MEKKDLDPKGIINWNNSYLLEKENNLWGDMEVPILDRVTKAFLKNGGKRFVYLPCGDGRNLPTLSKHLPFLIGVDSSENALNISRKRIEFYGLDNIVLLKNDIFETSFIDNQIDGVFCWDLFGHLVKIDLALLQLKRILKDNGLLIGSFFTLNDSTRVEDDDMVKLKDEEYIYRNQFYFRYYTKIEVENLLIDAGFLVEFIEAFSWDEPPHEGYREYPHTHESWFFIAKKI